MLLMLKQLQHKPMESVFAYILKTDITKLDKNIKQEKLYN